VKKKERGGERSGKERVGEGEGRKEQLCPLSSIPGYASGKYLKKFFCRVATFFYSHYTYNIKKWR